MKKELVFAFVLAATGACTQIGDPEGSPDDPIVDPDDPGDLPPGNASGGEDNTFDHPDSTPDPWELLERMQEQGPPEYSSRVHSCPKMRYETIGNVLASLGVDLSAAGELSAGRMWRTSDQALGAPNYGARARENLELTTASASKLFDIFSQAAPEIIAAMPTLEHCTVGGQPARMFNEFGQCTPDGISCLLGVPAEASHLEICNELVTRASTPEKGQVLAVAALLSAAHTCE